MSALEYTRLTLYSLVKITCIHVVSAAQFFLRRKKASGEPNTDGSLRKDINGGIIIHEPNVGIRENKHHHDINKPPSQRPQARRTHHLL